MSNDQTPHSPSYTAAELAARLDGQLRGDGARRIREVAALEDAGPESLSWAQDLRHIKQAWESKAGVILIPAAADSPPERTVVAVSDVQSALCSILESFAPPTPRVPPGVDPDAIVAASARVPDTCIAAGVFVGEHAHVGRGTQLHSGVYVGEHAAIGEDCVLWPNVVVRERVMVGDRVVLHPNVTVGADGFGYIFRQGRHRKVPQIGTVVIEDDVEIGANSAVDRAKCGVTRIRRGTKIDNLVQIGHNVDIGEDCVIVAQCGISGSTTLGHHVVLAGQVGLVDHLRIGNGAQIGAQAGVAKDVADGQSFLGSPAVLAQDFMRQQAALHRLSKWAEELRALRKRVEQLESSANHSKGD